MPNIKPTLVLNTLGNLGLRHDMLAEHNATSLQTSKLFIKPPNLDSPGIGVDLIALQNEREYCDMLELQEEMLEDSEREVIINANRIEEIYNVQAEIRKRFISANNFFKDCDEKEKFAESKYHEEKELHHEFRKTISEYKHGIEVLTEFRETLKTVKNQYQIYEDPFKEMAHYVDNWTSIKDFMDKCDALMLTQVEVVELQKRKLQELESLRLKLIKMSEDAKVEVLGLNNSLSELERFYVMIQTQSIKKEDIIGEVKDKILTHKLTSIRTIDEIMDMYRFLCKRNGTIPISKKENVEKHCDFIREEIFILRAVIEECNK